MEDLTTRLKGICDRVSTDLGGDLGHEVARVGEELTSPLRVAVVGRVSAGKSTLVNAFLERRYAATGVGETTQVVTSFEFDPTEHAEIVLRDGTVHEFGLRGGRLPRELPVDPTDVAVVRVRLSSEVLRGMTLVDTPGLSSVSEEQSAATREVLVAAEEASASAVSSAEAIAFVLNQALRKDESEVLTEFVSRGHGRMSAVNAVGLLTKADKLGEAHEEQPGLVPTLASARKLADRMSEDLRQQVAGVVPVAGLLAETGGSHALTEGDAADLETLAAAIDVNTQHIQLADAALFEELDLPVAAEDRRRLWTLLDRHGLAHVLDAIRTEGSLGATSLNSLLVDESGFRGVRNLVDRIFRNRAAVLKADTALALLERVSYRSGGGAAQGTAIRDQVERMRLDPAMHVLAEVAVLRLVDGRDVDLPEDLRVDLERLVMGRNPAEKLGMTSKATASPLDAAEEGIRRWREYEFAANLRQQQIAEVAIRSYHLLRDEVRARGKA